MTIKPDDIIIADPIDPSKIRAAFLGIAPGEPSGVGLIVAAAGELPTHVWSGQGPSTPESMRFIMSEAECRSHRASAAVPPFVAIGGAAVPFGHDEATRPVQSQSAELWLSAASSAGFVFVGDSPGLFSQSAWRDILGGPAQAAFHPGRWRYWSVRLVQSYFGRSLAPSQWREAEAVLIALAAMVARSESRPLARWVGDIGRRVSQAVLEGAT